MNRKFYISFAVVSLVLIILIICLLHKIHNLQSQVIEQQKEIIEIWQNIDAMQEDYVLLNNEVFMKEYNLEEN